MVVAQFNCVRVGSHSRVMRKPVFSKTISCLRKAAGVDYLLVLIVPEPGSRRKGFHFVHCII